MKTIALIEDNPDNRLLVSVILDGLYRLVEYDNGADALTGMPADIPDLVLLDISLPGMDGMEVLEHMKRDGRLKHLPVIALTAHAAKSDRERFLAAGFTDYLTKPIVDEALLVDGIARHLAGQNTDSGQT